MTKLAEKIVVRVFFIDPLLDGKHKPSVSIQGALRGEAPFVVGYHDFKIEGPNEKYAIEIVRDNLAKVGGFYVDGVGGLTTFVPKFDLLPMIAGPESSFNAVPDVHHE